MREHEAVIRSIIGSITEKHCSTIEKKCAMSDKMKLTEGARSYGRYLLNQLFLHLFFSGTIDSFGIIIY
jgi:hypothetical protein